MYIWCVQYIMYIHMLRTVLMYIRMLCTVHNVQMLRTVLMYIRMLCTVHNVHMLCTIYNVHMLSTVRKYICVYLMQAIQHNVHRIHVYVHESES